MHHQQKFKKIEQMIDIAKRMDYDIDTSIGMFNKISLGYLSSASFKSFADTTFRSGIQKGYILLKMIKRTGLTIEEFEAYLIWDKLKK